MLDEKGMNSVCTLTFIFGGVAMAIEYIYIYIYIYVCVCVCEEESSFKSNFFLNYTIVNSVLVLNIIF